MTIATTPWLSTAIDFYKYTMSQLQYELNRTTHVRFALTNRGSERIADLVPLATLRELFSAVQVKLEESERDK